MNLIEALKVIHRECCAHESCYTCPMRNQNSDECKSACYITDNPPYMWQFRSDHPMRVFV